MDPRFQNIVDKMRERQFRITPQRLAVLKILLATKAHPSAENIYEEVKKTFPTMSLATVYKTANLLREMGEISELALKDGSSRFDGNPRPHPHVVCARCKTIIDFDDLSLDSMTAEVARKTGFTISTHRLDFFGLCPLCQKAQST
jgi:Fur family transcriptional regulator, peroxide stress response regulator